MIIDATEESELRTLHRDCFFPVDETDRKISIGMRDNAMGFMDTPSLILALALMGKSEASDLALAGLARRRDFSGSLAVVWRSCRTYTYQGYPAPSRLFSGAWLDQWLQNADVAQVRLLLSALITPDNEFKRFPLTESPAIPSVILRWRKDAFDDDLHKRYNAVVQGAVDSAIVGLNDSEFSDESGNFNPFAEIDTYPAWPVSAVPRLLAIKTTNELARSMRDKIVIYLQQRKESGPTGVELEIMLRDLEKQWE